MEGCIHTLKNGYQKAAAREFISMVNQSISIWKNMEL
jgi:LysR family cyn operon transcriptional activator